MRKYKSQKPLVSSPEYIWIRLGYGEESQTFHRVPKLSAASNHMDFMRLTAICGRPHFRGGGLGLYRHYRHEVTYYKDSSVRAALMQHLWPSELDNFCGNCLRQAAREWGCAVPKKS